MIGPKWHNAPPAHHQPSTHIKKTCTAILTASWPNYYCGPSLSFKALCTTGSCQSWWISEAISGSNTNPSAVQPPFPIPLMLTAIGKSQIDSLPRGRAVIYRIWNQGFCIGWDIPRTSTRIVWMTISTQSFCINNFSQCYKLSIPTIMESKDSCPVWIFSRSPASLEMTSDRAKSLFAIVENPQIFCIFGMLVRIRLKRSKTIRADVPLSSIGTKADRRAPVSAINDNDEVNKKITD